MGPRSDERGNDQPVTWQRADSGLQWGRVRMNAEIKRDSTLPPFWHKLQWGRVRMNAEMGSVKTLNPVRVIASMGPRSDERGNPSLRKFDFDQLLASMGPRSDERGNIFFATITPNLTVGFNGAAFG